MGYFVKIINSDCKLPKANQAEAYNLMCELNFDNTKKNGGSYGPSKKQEIPKDQPHPDRWFSWMNWNYHETCKTAQEILEQLGFQTRKNEDGDILIENYDDKSGQEGLFLHTIGHLLEGSIEWQGEDGDAWKNVFSPEGMKHLEGRLVFE